VETVLNVLLATPDQAHFEGPAVALTLPGAGGSLQVLPGHAPLVGALGLGEMRIDREEGAVYFLVAGGFFRVLGDQVTVVADQVTDPASFTVAEARDALETTLRLPKRTEEEMAAARAAVAHARVRLRSALRREAEESERQKRLRPTGRS
jgi:F-type H+-transporting ATPase subunit epsilon